MHVHFSFKHFIDSNTMLSLISLLWIKFAKRGKSTKTIFGWRENDRKHLKGERDLAFMTRTDVPWP